eukprot:gene9865-11528_t
MSLSINGVIVTDNIQLVSPVLIVAPIPEQVINGGLYIRKNGVYSNGFQLELTPIITAISSPLASGGDLVIDGYYFNRYSDEMDFLSTTVNIQGGINCSDPINTNSNIQLTCQIPPGSGTHLASVRVGSKTSDRFNFTYQPAITQTPTVTPPMTPTPTVPPLPTPTPTKTPSPTPSNTLPPTPTPTKTPTPTPAVPTVCGWSQNNIGPVSTPGSASGLCTSLIRVKGSGEDIYNTVDAFFYANKPSNSSSAYIRGQVVSQTFTDGWAKAGVMFRESVEPGSKYAYLFASPEHGINLQCRSATNGEAYQQAQKPSVDHINQHLKLIRSGNLFTAQVSVNGLVWNTIGSCTVPISKTSTFGLAVTAHNNTKVSEALFSSVLLVQ